MADIGNVSTLSLIFMAVSAALSILVPAAAITWMAIKRKLDWKALLLGAALFLFFAMGMENILHSVVLGTDPSKSAIYQQPIVYMIYGGFAAGIFEETARLLGFLILIRNRPGGPAKLGISYGLGHGGIESIMIGGMASIGNLATSILWNSGTLTASAASMDAQQLEKLREGMQKIISVPPEVFLAGGIERVVALVLQISLSVFVLKAVAEKKWQFFAFAILIHAGVDMVAVLYQRDIVTSLYLVEGVALLAAAVAAVSAYRFSRKKTAGVGR